MVKSKSQHHALTQISQTKPAAVNDFSLNEKTIGKVLTQNQHQIVSQVAKVLSLSYKSLTPKQLQQEIELTLICPHEFTKAGKDFYKKLNAIKKTISEGKWRPPVRYGCTNQTNSSLLNHSPDDPMQALKAKIQRLELELQGEMNALDSLMTEKFPSFKAATQQRIDEFNEQIKALKKALSNPYGAQKNVI